MQNEYLEFILTEKGKNIAMYDLNSESSVANFAIIQHFATNAENKKFADNFIQKFSLTELPDGYNRGEWLIFDMGETIIHSFTLPYREKYNLDKLWQNKKIELDNKKSKK